MNRISYIAICLQLCTSLFLGGCSQSAPELQEALAFSASATDSVTEQTAEAMQESAAGQVYVYICGAVKEPDVYCLKEGARIVDAVEAAGGFLPDAAKEAINLAEPVSDGMQIVIATNREAAAIELERERAANGLVNINKAALNELCTLNGIGEAKGRAIIEAREALGGFTDIEQLKEVSGIGESLFLQIKDSIYIE